MLGNKKVLSSTTYRTTSISAHAYYLANEFFRVRTNREGVLSEKAYNLAVHFFTDSQIYVSTFLVKKPLELTNLLIFLAF